VLGAVAQARSRHDRQPAHESNERHQQHDSSGLELSAMKSSGRETSALTPGRILRSPPRQKRNVHKHAEEEDSGTTAATMRVRTSKAPGSFPQLLLNPQAEVSCRR